MGRNANATNTILPSLYRQLIDNPQKAVCIVDEPALTRNRRLTAKSAECIERGEHCNPDPGLFGGCEASQAHFRRIVVGGAICLMMEILEFTDD